MWLFRPPDGRFFGPEQRRQVEALFEVILPGSDSSPGATDADAAEFLDRPLAMDDGTYYEIGDWRKLYTESLPKLDAAAAGVYGRPILELDLSELTALMASLSKGELAQFGEAKDQRSFFTAVRNHCIEGCFADPRWGGNKGGVMWRWYGYLEPAKPYSRATSPAGDGGPTS